MLRRCRFAFAFPSWLAQLAAPSLTEETTKLNRHCIMRNVMALAHRLLSSLNDIPLDSSNVLVHLAASNHDFGEQLDANGEMSLEGRARFSLVLAEAVYLRDFVKGSQVIIRNHDLFQMVN